MHINITSYCKNFIFEEMVRLGGFEPPASGATIQRSNQLSYSRISFEQVSNTVKTIRLQEPNNNFTQEVMNFSNSRA